MTFDWTISWPVVIALCTLALGLLRLHRCIERRLTTAETTMNERHEANLVQFKDLKDQMAALVAALLGRQP